MRVGALTILRSLHSRINFNRIFWSEHRHLRLVFFRKDRNIFEQEWAGITPDAPRLSNCVALLDLVIVLKAFPDNLELSSLRFRLVDRFVPQVSFSFFLSDFWCFFRHLLSHKGFSELSSQFFYLVHDDLFRFLLFLSHRRLLTPEFCL